MYSFVAHLRCYQTYINYCGKILNSTFLSKTEITQKVCISIHSRLNSMRETPTVQLVPAGFFEDVKNKDKEAFFDMIGRFETKNIHKRGQVEFIYKALEFMKEFGVHKDLETYKALIDILPKGKYIPTNIFQAEFMHYPKQQQCIIDLLEQMENNGVIPDEEVEFLLLNIFGKRGHPLRKCWRMLYWMPKFKNLSPWPLPAVIPNNSLELAKLAIQRICSVDLQSVVSEYQASDLEDSIDDTWIVSSMSPKQKQLLESHPKNVALYVEGAFRIWLRDNSVNYFILRADAVKREIELLDTDDVSKIRIPFFQEKYQSSALVELPSVHEQEDGTILALCATGTSSRDSLLSWIRFLNKENPALDHIPVLFTLKSPLGEVIPVNDLSKEKLETENKLESGADKT